MEDLKESIKVLLEQIAPKCDLCEQNLVSVPATKNCYMPSRYKFLERFYACDAHDTSEPTDEISLFWDDVTKCLPMPKTLEAFELTHAKALRKLTEYINEIK